MGLHRFRPLPSGRMGTLWTLASVRQAALLEFGCMGHMLYGHSALGRGGVPEECKLYSTHIDEADIALGGTERISRAIAHIIQRDRPPVIFLLPSSVPEMIGTDLPAICEELQGEYPDTLIIPFGYGGFNIGQHRGVQEALLTLARKLPVETEPTPMPTFNLIGSCADLFRFQADAQEVVRLMEGAFGMKPVCIMTSDTSVEQLQQMGGAHINLVLRREGEPAAKHLRKRFGTPYLMARPYGIQGTAKWLEQISGLLQVIPNLEFINGQMAEIRKCLTPAGGLIQYSVQTQPEEVRLSVGGHADVVKGILSFGCGELSLPQGACWCDSQEMADDDLPYFSEEQWVRHVSDQKNGFLMASGEILDWAGRNTELQISNPDVKWRLNPYESPFVGFRGALQLSSLWINEALRTRSH